MSFKKNFRGADTYAPPATEKYRSEYDRIFGKKEKPPFIADPMVRGSDEWHLQRQELVDLTECDHDWVKRPIVGGHYCPKCGEGRSEIEKTEMGATTL